MDKITNENYRDYKAINQSSLKALAIHPEEFLNAEDKDWSDGLEFGDVIDKLLFTPDEFEEDYFVTNMDNLPSDNIKAAIEHVVENTKEGVNVSEEDVLKACETIGYGQSWKPSTLLRKIAEGGGFAYGGQLLKSRGKRVLSMENHMKMMMAVKVLKEHPFTSEYVWKDLPDHIERFTQFPVLARNSKYDVFYKGLLDLMLVNHETKIIYPWDLKTTGTNPLRFQGTFLKYRYDLQAALYTYILQMITEGAVGNYPFDRMNFPFDPTGYTVANFGFIVVGNNDVHNPVRYKCTDADINGGLMGGKTDLGYEYKGVMELTEELIWHQKEDKWNYPKEVYDNDGELSVDVY